MTKHINYSLHQFCVCMWVCGVVGGGWGWGGGVGGFDGICLSKMKHSFSKVHVKMSRPIPTSNSV